MTSSSPPETFEQVQLRRGRRADQRARRERIETEVAPAIIDAIARLDRTPVSRTIPVSATLRNLEPIRRELEGELTTALPASVRGNNPGVPMSGQRSATNPTEFIAGRQQGAVGDRRLQAVSIPGISIERGDRGSTSRRARVETLVTEPQTFRRRRAIAGFNGEVSEFNLLGTRNSVGAGSLLGSA